MLKALAYNKNMTQKQQKGRIGFKLKGLALFGIASMVALATTAIPNAAADQFDAQIQELQRQNSTNQGALSDLRGQAASYQEIIAVLREQINALQAQINSNVAKQGELQAKIEEGQRELDRQRQTLGADIKAMYVDGDISTIEMLATSRNLSDFIDKESYRNAVQKKIQETLKKITALQSELKSQKQIVEAMLLEQKAQQASLDASRAEQNRLLSYNQQQQATFSKQLKDNNAKIADLRAQQAIENARLFGGGGGGVLGGGNYPWGYAKCYHTGQVEGSCYNYDWAVSGSIYNWETGGYGYRNCTDWVSYRVRVAGGYVPAGLGNAKQWDDRAGGYGFAVSDTPRKGAAAVSNAGEYGHVMYVEAVNGDGSIFISDYNRAGTGKYNTTTLERVSEGRYRNSGNGVVSSLSFVYF